MAKRSLFDFRTHPVLWASLTLPCVGEVNLGECISDIYQWSLAIVGIVAFVQIVYAGWLYLTAFGNTGKASSALSKIGNAVLGIILLFSSYLILKTINPDLVGGRIELPEITKEEKIKNTGGENDLTKIEVFDVDPKRADLSDDTLLKYKLKIYASSKGFKEVCSEVDQELNKNIKTLQYNVFMEANGEAKQLVRNHRFKMSDFGDSGKTNSYDFEEKVSKTDIDSKSISVSYYATFECLVGKGAWRQLNKSSSVSVRIQP